VMCMEACVGAHHLSRKLRMLGHEYWKEFLDGENSTPRLGVSSVLLSKLFVSLCGRGCDDYVKGAIAKKIIDVAKRGERHPDALCEQVLKDIRRQQM
jgi:hypothetical protein